MDPNGRLAPQIALFAVAVNYKTKRFLEAMAYADYLARFHKRKKFYWIQKLALSLLITY